MTSAIVTGYEVDGALYHSTFAALDNFIFCASTNWEFLLSINYGKTWTNYGEISAMADFRSNWKIFAVYEFGNIPMAILYGINDIDGHCYAVMLLGDGTILSTNMVLISGNPVDYLPDLVFNIKKPIGAAFAIVFGSELYRNNAPNAYNFPIQLNFPAEVGALTVFNYNRQSYGNISFYAFSSAFNKIIRIYNATNDLSVWAYEETNLTINDGGAFFIEGSFGFFAYYDSKFYSSFDGIEFTLSNMPLDFDSYSSRFFVNGPWIGFRSFADNLVLYATKDASNWPDKSLDVTIVNEPDYYSLRVGPIFDNYSGNAFTGSESEGESIYFEIVTFDSGELRSPSPFDRLLIQTFNQARFLNLK